MAPDQRYCLACGARRGAPRVPVSDPAAEPARRRPPQQGGRPADVSPLAAVIGIALLGGMLLIGVLIGRGNSDDAASNRSCRSAPAAPHATSTSDWRRQGGSGPTSPASGRRAPTGTPCSSARCPRRTRRRLRWKPPSSPPSRAARRPRPCSTRTSTRAFRRATTSIYSGVYDSSKEADVGLEQLGDGFPDASVIHVSTKASGGGSSIPQAGDTTTPDLGGVNGETTIPSDPALVPGADTGGVTESEK